MTVIQIPINLGPNRDSVEVALPGYNAFLYDGYVDSLGVVNRRPGLVEWCDLSVASGIDGLFWWDRQSLIIAICNGAVYEVDQNGTETARGGDTIQTGASVYFADFNTTLYAANGSRMLGIPSSGAAAYIADADAPTAVTAIADIDTYLLALKADTEQVWYSQPGDPTDWQALFFSEQYKPDLVKMIGVRNDIIEAVGTQSIGGWRDDGSTPFIRDPQYTVDHGIIAPHSFKYCTGLDGSGSWYWLNSERQIVKMVGRTVYPVAAGSLSRYLQGFASVSDAIGGYCIVNGFPHYILTFPTENKTIAVNLGIGSWSEFGKWNSGNASHDRWRGKSYAYSPAWNLQLVGDHSTGKIYKLDNSVYQDDSATLNTLIRTGNIDHGTMSVRKFPKGLYFWLKKTNESEQADVVNMSIKWRDNGATSWKTERTIALGFVGESSLRGKISGMELGSYYSRQYEISITANEALAFVRMEEEL